jgi:hypothetical protein
MTIISPEQTGWTAGEPNMQAATVAEKRSTKRKRIYLVADVRVDGGARQQARIRDVTAGGALLEGTPEPVVGSLVQVTCGLTCVQGRVAWAEAGWFGVEFAEALKGGYLRDQQGSRMRVSAPRQYRSGAELTPAHT